MHEYSRLIGLRGVQACAFIPSQLNFFLEGVVESPPAAQI